MQTRQSNIHPNAIRQECAVANEKALLKFGIKFTGSKNSTLLNFITGSTISRPLV